MPCILSMGGPAGWHDGQAKMEQIPYRAGWPDGRLVFLYDCPQQPKDEKIYRCGIGTKQHLEKPITCLFGGRCDKKTASCKKRWLTIFRPA